MSTAVLLLDDRSLLASCRVETYRSHGPGGQHANRTDSAVRLTHLATGVTAQCQDHRQQARNQHDAIRRLRVRLACAVRGQADPAWLTPWLRGGRFLIGPHAEAFPCVVAVVLDALATHQGHLAETAAAVGCSSTQLIKLILADKEAHQAANAIRAAHGHGALHGR